MNESYIFSGKNGRIRHFERYRQIALVLVKYRLGGLIKTLGLDKFLPLRIPIPRNPWRKEKFIQT